MELHIYGQRWWHDSATIVGDRQALELLRQLIDTALENDTAGGEVFSRDGEGYHVRVIRAMGEIWSRLKLPYSDDIAQDFSSGKEWPSDF